MSKLFKAVVASVVLGWCAGPAFACLNDVDTYRHEQQFKSLYPDTPLVTPQSEQPEINSDRGPLLVYGGPIVGVALLSGAGLLCFTRRSI